MKAILCERCPHRYIYSIYFGGKVHYYCEEHFLELGDRLDTKDHEKWAEMLDPSLAKIRKMRIAKLIAKVSKKKKTLTDTEKTVLGLICSVCGSEKLPIGICPHCFLEKKKKNLLP